MRSMGCASAAIHPDPWGTVSEGVECGAYRGLIMGRSGQGTNELASILGIPSAQLRPQLRHLANEGVIAVEKHNLGAVKRHTYRAVERAPGHHAQSLAVGAAA